MEQGDFGRPHAGRSIGRGTIEGRAKRMGRRLTAAGRGWRVGYLDVLATLIASVDTPE